MQCNDFSARNDIVARTISIINSRVARATFGADYAILRNNFDVHLEKVKLGWTRDEANDEL